MTESKEENKIIELELMMVRDRLNGIHDTLKISMGCIIALLILIVLILWFSPTF